MDWYYAENNQQKGPVTDEGLATLVNSGVVTPATLVWHPGMSEWKAYGTVQAAAAPSMASPSASAFCSQCGKQYRMDEMVTLSGVLVCGSCKPVFVQQLREGTVSVAKRKYGGFWIRVVANLIDTFIVIIGYLAFLFLVIRGSLGSLDAPEASESGVAILAQLVGYVLIIFSEGWFLVNKGGTPGKLICGLRVIRASGAKISWGRAIGRVFARSLSSFCFIGFLMAAWDEEKRTLHDRICDTRVIRN
jgi:uncharacterized RDD family membrane protein YckC